MNKLLLYLIPSYRYKNTFLKILISILIIFVVLCLLKIKLEDNFRLLQSALLYSPVSHAQNLYDNKKIVESYEFINFYMSIPFYEKNIELEKLLSKIENERSDIEYITSNIWKGFIGEESEENYGKIVIKSWIPLQYNKTTN